MNAGKEQKVLALLRAWRKVAVVQGREQWRLVFTSGKPNKRHDVSRTGYSSQEHDCGYVAKNNRPRQAHFHCRWCGATRHADVNAARNLLRRRSDSAIGDVRRPKQAILGELVRRFSERYPRLKGEPPDPRLSNPYFKDWTVVVMSNAASG